MGSKDGAMGSKDGGAAGSKDGGATADAGGSKGGGGSKGAAGPDCCWQAFQNFGYCAGNGGNGPPSANGPEDVAFLRALIAQVRREHPTIPTGRTVVFGYSQGGSMAFRLGCEASALIDGVVVGGQSFFDPLVGYYDYTNDVVPTGAPGCTPVQPPPFLSFVGTADMIYGRTASTPGFVAYERWKLYSQQVFGCTGEPSTVPISTTLPNLPSGSQCFEYAQCRTSTFNRFCDAQGSGHGGFDPEGFELIPQAFRLFFGVAGSPVAPASASKELGGGGAQATPPRVAPPPAGTTTSGGSTGPLQATAGLLLMLLLAWAV